MATVQTIATTLTADARPAITSLRTFDAEVGKAFTRLDAMNKRAISSGGGAAGIDAIGRSSSNASRGVLELSRGIEDFSTQFGTQGFAGGIRAASNNLSQMAMVMGGPVAGAIAGFAAAGATLAMPYIESFFNATEAAKRFSESLDIAIKKSRDLFESQAKEMEGAVDFRAERRGLDGSKDADAAVNRRQVELDKIAARQKEIEAARQRNRLDDSIPIGARGTLEEQARWMEQVAKSEQLDRELMVERLELIRKERDLRVEMGQLRADGVKLQEKELEIQKQKDQEDFAGRIRKFQEEDAKDAERELKDNENALMKAERDAERLAGMRSSGRGGLAQVATANSQSLLRAQEMVKQAAKASTERQKQLEEARKQVAELKAIRRALEGVEDADDVNLN